MDYFSDEISRNTISSSNTMMFSTSNNFKNSAEDGEFMKSKGILSSDPFQQQNNGGLTRYRSAPSTFFASFLDGTNANGNGANSDSSQGEDEEEKIFSAFLNSGNGSSSNMEVNHQLQFSSNLKQESMEYGRQEIGFLGGDSQVGYDASMDGGSGNGSYGAGMENQIHGRMNGGDCSSNLIRQSSSPAGFFTGFDVMREIESFRASNGTHGESSGLNFTSQPSPTSRFMPTIAENANQNLLIRSSSENVHILNGNDANGKLYVPNLAIGSWNDSTSNSLKRNRHGDMKIFSSINGLQNQNGESGNIRSGLVHHLSLPKTSTEMAAVENYLQFQQDVVPCKTRAKRGCATHPRSIAERMRRIRISERMKKLQELFPDMDKQANTADMLDLAVGYIKDLQKQVLTLTDQKAKCSCSSA